jgi:TolA-binding protein
MSGSGHASAFLVVLALTAGGGVFAQTEPEVRRALPVVEGLEGPVEIRRAEPAPRPSPTPSPTPPPPTATPMPVMRAVPVAPTPAPTPVATPRPLVVATPIPPTPAPAAPPPAAPVGVPVPAAPSDEPGDIRIAPATPGTASFEQQQFDLASALYTRKQYESAAAEFERYLGSYPGGGNRAAALFRIGECYRNLGREEAARTAFEMLIGEFPTGEIPGSGAYRLAEMHMAQRDYISALPLFRRAADSFRNEDLIVAARFREARCLELLARPENARVAYRGVLQLKGSASHQDAARFALAAIALETGRRDEAITYLRELGEGAALPAARLEATVRAATLLGESNRIEPATELFRKALTIETDQPGQWRDLARLGLLRIDFLRERYREVADAWVANPSWPDAIRPEAMLLAADALRRLKDYPRAAALYQGLLRDFPDSIPASEAGYQYLVCLHNSASPELPGAIEEYLKGNPTSENAARVRLLKAEMAYKAGDHAAAAEAYAAAIAGRLPAELRPEAQYRLGWCRLQIGKPAEAAEAFGALLKEYPRHVLVPAALAQRGIALQQQTNYTGALADFEALIARHPSAPEREVALQQKALILGQQQNSAGMRETFERLLREYPKTSGAAQANYWIGWTAFDAKDYKAALGSLERARKLDAAQYGERAGLRVLLCHFNLGDLGPVAREVDAWIAEGKGAKIPAEVLRWSGTESLRTGDAATAERHLAALAQTDRPQQPDAEVWLALGRARIALGKWVEADAALRKHAELAKDPPDQAAGQLALAEAAIGSGATDAAAAAIEKALRLQPEGRLNAEARMLSGRLELKQQRFDQAAKSFLSVALLHDDAELTPRALDSARLAYAKAGNAAESARLLNQLKTRYPEYRPAAE